MQTVLSLVEDEGIFRLCQFVCYLESAMSRQAMHDFSLGWGVRHQFGIDLEALEILVRLAFSASWPILVHVSV